MVVEHLIAKFALHRHRLLTNRLALWIMTPPTPQRTALKKGCRADARAVVDGIALYVEDKTCHYRSKR